MPGQGDPRPNSQDLTRWAETADGTRDKELYLVENGGKYEVKKAVDNQAGDKEIMKLYTGANLQRQRPRIEVNGVDITAKLQESDAIFWTQSAVEKFLWPYYHSHRLFDDPILQPDVVYQRYMANDAIIAILHVAPSRSLTLPGQELSLGVVKKNKTFDLVSVAEFDALRKQGLV